MRMSVSIGRFAVSGPAGVGDAEGAADPIAHHLFLQQGNLALGTHDLDPPVGTPINGDSSTVTTAIFNPFEILIRILLAVTAPPHNLRCHTRRFLPSHREHDSSDEHTQMPWACLSNKQG